MTDADERSDGERIAAAFDALTEEERAAWYKMDAEQRVDWAEAQLLPRADDE